MMDSASWERYFLDNRGRPDAFVDPVVRVALDPELVRVLVRSLQHFHLGEAGEGRVAHEAERSDDPALDAQTRSAIHLYVREEGRHARELAAALRSLGASTVAGHWSEKLFRRGRRLMGLRTKLMTIGAAEVVGVVFYGILRDHAPTPDLRRLGELIGADEAQHLAFQAEWFGRVIEGTPAPLRAPYALLLGTELVLILGSAVIVFTIDHGPLLRALGVRKREVIGRCVEVARGALGRLRSGGAAEDAGPVEEGWALAG